MKKVNLSVMEQAQCKVGGLVRRYLKKNVFKESIFIIFILQDAHNCIINFDKNISLFAVYDGHGGHEVALYCSQKLPDFIRNTVAYKKGDFKNALIDAFLEFDATIATNEVISSLKELAETKDNEYGNVEASSEDEENVSNLYEEASMPIEQVMEKYQSTSNLNVKKIQGEKIPNSPFLRARKNNEKDISMCFGASSSKCLDTNTDISVVSSSNSNMFTNNKSENDDDNLDFKTTGDNTCTIHSDDRNLSPDSCSITVDHETKVNEKNDLNGEVKYEEISSKTENECSSTTTSENGGIKIVSKGKGKAILVKKTQHSTRQKSLRIRNARQLYNKLLDFQEDSDSEDENDETFEGTNSNSSSDIDDAAESSDGIEEEEEEMFEEEDDNDFTRNITEEPGSDSGCTAVVALVHDNNIYVANAGDSRCIICRKGQAIEMSVDHKPEDEPEMERIIKAGGKVTQDGRVNGGLNLSRAIGDHAYKQNKELSNKEQMITALPDVRILKLNFDEDEFMVLACDGIWNFMSSQEVVDFVRPRLEENKHKVSHICEEMFDHCLAPNTMGDGTGCDNMTAIIVQFKYMKDKSNNLKRSASPSLELDQNTNSNKKVKTDEVNVD